MRPAAVLTMLAGKNKQTKKTKNLPYQSTNLDFLFFNMPVGIQQEKEALSNSGENSMRLPFMKV